MNLFLKIILYLSLNSWYVPKPLMNMSPECYASIRQEILIMSNVLLKQAATDRMKPRTYSYSKKVNTYFQQQYNHYPVVLKDSFTKCRR